MAIAEVLRIVWTQVEFNGITKFKSKLKNPTMLPIFCSFEKTKESENNWCMRNVVAINAI